jgi:class 3 adenylate cyclase
MVHHLFEAEREVVLRAERMLADAGLTDAEARSAYAGLLDSYRKLLHDAERLVRISDRNERELARMAERQREATEEIRAKNRELETLAVKLAKYLSPQVYQSVFSGRQDVVVAARRKKLSVLFADLVGFTEITERLEPEEVAGMLNRYLTEMSKIAMEHGATVDKYVGDAVLAFVGDPDSRGVREDALACVRMGLAMQRRMADLARSWRRAGLARPPLCRIGISTGFCTVGNFGGEERMDYTIIGNGVNLASRLQRAAPPGSVLIPFETFALVRDEVLCDDIGPLELKGVAEPVNAYLAVELFENLDEDVRVLREDSPNLKFEIDLAALSEPERRRAAELLKRVLDRL